MRASFGEASPEPQRRRACRIAGSRLLNTILRLKIATGVAAQIHDGDPSLPGRRKLLHTEQSLDGRIDSALFSCLANGGCQR
jgi:hypothetical protein